MAASPVDESELRIREVSTLAFAALAILLMVAALTVACMSMLQ
jgi:hypothetical protein